MAERGTRPIAIGEAGVVASAILARPARGRALAVTEASFYVDADGRIFCIGGPTIGRGPLNAIADLAEEQTWPELALVEGAAVTIADGRIELVRGPSLRFDGMTTWRAPPWPAKPARATLQSALARLIEAARTRLPPTGIAPVVFDQRAGEGLAGAFTRRATLGVAMLEDWLAGRLDGDDEMAEAGQEAVGGLLGLGPGLTPSGDDFLIGASLALQAIGRRDAADAIATHVRAAPAGATSPISRAHIDAALAGHPGATSHAMISALLKGDAAAYPALLDRIDGIGHCSGWDTLSGVAVALAAASSRIG